MKRLSEVVPQKLGEILIKHGRSALHDPLLCQNLLKDYCGSYKEEISLLVSAVNERIPMDLLLSQGGIQREFLRSLLVKRLRHNRSLSVSDARWAVESWSAAIRALSRAESASPAEAETTSVRELPAGPGAEQSIANGVIGKSDLVVRSISVSPHGETIASGGDDAVIRIWNLRSRSTTLLREYDGPVAAVAFSPNGVLLASAIETRTQTKSTIQIWDLHSGEVSVLGECGPNLPSLSFSPGGKRLAWTSAGSQSEIHVWNLQTGQRRLLKGGWKGPASISFSPDGSQIASADSDRSNPAIRVWDLETGTARVLGRSGRQITSVAFVPDTNRLASGSWDETVRLWDIRTGQPHILGKNCSCVCAMAVSTQGDLVAAYSLDSKIRVWNVNSGRSRTIGECQGVNTIAFLIDERALVTGGNDGTIRLWNTLS